jgi:hypothetical protein
MRIVASADGHLHPRELALIASFESELPERSGALGSLSEDPALRQVYVRSLVMLALADGRMSDVEREVIGELCDRQEISAEDVEAEILVVKRRFLSVFRGVSVFRDSVVRVARELGLPEDEVAALGGEA